MSARHLLVAMVVLVFLQAAVLPAQAGRSSSRSRSRSRSRSSSSGSGSYRRRYSGGSSGWSGSSGGGSGYSGYNTGFDAGSVKDLFARQKKLEESLFKSHGNTGSRSSSSNRRRYSGGSSGWSGSSGIGSGYSGYNTGFDADSVKDMFARQKKLEESLRKSHSNTGWSSSSSSGGLGSRYSTYDTSSDIRSIADELLARQKKLEESLFNNKVKTTKPKRNKIVSESGDNLRESKSQEIGPSQDNVDNLSPVRATPQGTNDSNKKKKDKEKKKKSNVKKILKNALKLQKKIQKTKTVDKIPDVETRQRPGSGNRIIKPKLQSNKWGSYLQKWAHAMLTRADVKQALKNHPKPWTEA